MEVGEKGICRLAIVPVRAAASDKSEMVTQLLFGDHYELLEVSGDKKWLRVKIHFDGYEGWVDAKQHAHISEAYFTQINNSDYKICTDVTSSILYKKHHIAIVMGSILPIATNELFKVEEQLAFNGESKSLSQKREFDFLKQIAQKYLNAPYLWGGRSPFGIDCSGFSQIVFRIAGYSLPRDASQQINSGTVVNGLVESQPGDLAFFCNELGNINHVGILLGDEKIIHASGKVKIDDISEAGILEAETSQLTHHLTALKRMLKH